MPGFGRSLRFFVLASAVVLPGCAGGSGGGAGSPNPSPGGGNAQPATPPAPAVNYDTAEYRRGYGLGLINALAAYDRGYTGQGATVAVIDSGIDVDHPDLVDQIHSASTNIIDNSAATLNDTDSHGTAVAGVIVAKRNGVGIHGVAFDAKVLAIRADDPGTCEDDDGCSFVDRDVAAAVTYAMNNGARVINLSMGGDDPPGPVLRNAFNAAVAGGAIIVIAAGNDYDPATGAGTAPTAFSSYATQGGAAGQVIIAGAANQFGNIADFSNRAGGAAQNVYLMAPGDTVLTTNIGGGLFYLSGTSLAAPHIVGAAALLIQAFPNLSAREVVEILLTSAADKGAPGVDAITGRGLLDLDAAFRPRGALSLAAPAGAAADSASSSTIGQTALALGPAFGDALSGASILGDALTLDAYRRPYRVDLRQHILPASDSLGLAYRVGGRSDWVATESLAAGPLSLRAVFETETHGARAPWAFDPLQRRRSDRGRVEGRFGLGSHGEISWTGGALSGSLSPRSQEDALLTPIRESAPYLSLIERGGAAMVENIVLPAGFSLSARTILGGREVSFRGGEVEASAASLEFGWSSPAFSIGVRYGSLAEKGGVLGGFARGAFGEEQSAHTRFAGARVQFALGDEWTLAADGTAGRTDFDAGSWLWSGPGSLASSAFALRGQRKNAIRQGDALVFAFGQPLRVDEGVARFTVPTGFDFITGAASFSQGAIDLAPSGKEWDWEAAYILPLNEAVRAKLNLLYREDAGHRAGIDEAAFVVRLLARW